MNENILNQLTEIINLEAIRELPKATEHFIRDIHGKFEAFDHLRRNCSGIIRIKVKELFGDTITEQELNHLCLSIYYEETEVLVIGGGDAGLASVTAQENGARLFLLIDCKIKCDTDKK